MNLPPDFFQIDQIGILVRDLDRSMAQYHELLGWGPWDVFEYQAPWLHDTEIRGEPREYTMLGAEAMVGGLVVELIEPTSPSPYTEWMEKHGEGLHHILVGWAGDLQSSGESTGDDDLEERSARVREAFAARGIGVLMSGRVGDVSQYYYLDTEPALKVIIESGGATGRDLRVVRRHPPEGG
jgi:methylmalonyl-CoA/ethylmalonyl-CoA epimerase